MEWARRRRLRLIVCFGAMTSMRVAVGRAGTRVGLLLVSCVLGSVVQPPFAAAQTATTVISVDILRRYESAVAATRKGELSSALRLLDDVVLASPTFARAHDARGVVLAMLSRIPESEASFQHAIELDADLAEAHFNLGKLLLDSSRPSEAREHLKHAFALQPSHAPTIHLLVDSILTLHEEAAAVDVLTFLHQRFISHAPELHAEVGQALLEHGKKTLAVDQFRLLLREDVTPSQRREAELALSRLGSER